LALLWPELCAKDACQISDDVLRRRGLMEDVRMFGFLIVAGTLIGVFMAFMAHPSVSARVLRKPKWSGDHPESHD
jgi:hypothetical protein